MHIHERKQGKGGPDTSATLSEPMISAHNSLLGGVKKAEFFVKNWIIK